MDDKNIIALYFERDERALTETKDRYGRLLISVANNILSSPEDSEECETDTYVRAWNSIPPTVPEILSSYLCKITRNLAFNKLRERKRRLDVSLIIDELAEVLPDTEGDITEDIELRDTMNGFLASIDKTRRIIFLRRYFYMQSVKEIARQIGATEGAIKVSLSRTRKMLKEYLTERGIVI